MRIKKIHIEIKTLEQALKEAGEVFEGITKGKKVKKKRAVYFSNLKEIRRTLTEKRLEIIKTVKDKKPVSIYELAKMLHRNLKNVLQDVEYLKELGIVEVEETVDKKIPHVYYDRIDLQIAV
jgi:predicted transcriptional regulator